MRVLEHGDGRYRDAQQVYAAAIERDTTSGRELCRQATAGRTGIQRAPSAPSLPGLTRAAFAKYGFSAASLLTDWAAIVGADVAKYTEPERLKWPRQPGIYDETGAEERGRPGATLILRVDPGAGARRAIPGAPAHRAHQRLLRLPGRGRAAARAGADWRRRGPSCRTQRGHRLRANPRPWNLPAIADARLRAALEHMAHAIVMRKAG